MITSIAVKKRISDIVSEYWEKYDNIQNTLKEFEDAYSKLKSDTSVGGSYGGDVVSSLYVGEKTAKSVLLKSAWRNVYDGLNIEKIVGAKDRKKFTHIISETPPEFTMKNIADTFGDFIIDPRYHMLKGLAECFVDLDPAYRSHSKVKIGVVGLPKRIIIANVGYWGSWGAERLRDVLNSILVYRGKPRMENIEYNKLVDDTKAAGEMPFFAGKLKAYQNGNFHVIFDQQGLRDINLALAEFYGDVLPDTPQETTKKRASTAVSKDLQFYPTPDHVLKMIFNDIWLGTNPVNILEPSCGDGRIMDFIHGLDDIKVETMLGFEIDVERVAIARNKGHNVSQVNFLEVPSAPNYDLVVMNPPFYGQHYKLHIEHAKGFVKEGGLLVSILPATAHYDHKNTFGRWRDLPVGSFTNSGTNINTGYMVWRK